MSTSPTPTVARSAGTIMLAFLFGHLIGLVAKILIGATFPAGTALDAFYAANRPAETLVNILAGGILVSSFIPVFIKFLVARNLPSAWHLASASANLVFILMTLMAVLASLFAWPIVEFILGQGFSPAKQALTVSLLRIQSLSIIFFGLTGLLAGVLNSHHKFLLPALAPGLYQVGQIFGLLVLSPFLGIHGLAWGVVIGSSLGLVIQIPGLLALKGRYTPTLGLKDPAVTEVFRLMAPRMFGAAVVQAMLWVNTLLASQFNGAVYALTLGFMMMYMAQAAIAQSVATAVMPSFSAQFARGQLDELRQMLASSLRAVILLSLPASLGLIVLGRPIIAFLYQRNQFTAETTSMVAWAMAWYAAGLIFHSVLEVLVRAYYAMHDTRTPVLVGASAMALSILLSFIFLRLFSLAGWMPHGGLALAVSLSTALEVSTLLFLMRRRLGNIQGRAIATGLASSALASLAMLASLALWLKLTAAFSNALITLGGMALGALVYGLFLVILRVPEVRTLLAALRRRLAR